MNIEKLKSNFKMVYPKIIIIFYCIMIPISLFIQLPIFLPALLSFPLFIMDCEIIMTIQILRIIYAISILIGFIAGNIFIFNIEKKILSVIDKKCDKSDLNLLLYISYLGSWMIFIIYFFIFSDYFSDYVLQIKMIMRDMIISLNLCRFFHVIMITLDHFKGIFISKLWFIAHIPLYFWMYFSNQLKKINLK